MLLPSEKSGGGNKTLLFQISCTVTADGNYVTNSDRQRSIDIRGYRYLYCILTICNDFIEYPPMIIDLDTNPYANDGYGSSNVLIVDRNTTTKSIAYGMACLRFNRTLAGGDVGSSVKNSIGGVATFRIYGIPR